MALSDYKFCEKGEVRSIKNGDSFSVLIDNKVACSMTGGAHRFHTENEAEFFGRQLARGYTSGTFLSEDINNYVSN